MILKSCQLLCLGVGVGVTCDGPVSHPGGVEILLVEQKNKNQDKLSCSGSLSEKSHRTLDLF